MEWQRSVRHHQKSLFYITHGLESREMEKTNREGGTGTGDGGQGGHMALPSPASATLALQPAPSGFEQGPLTWPRAASSPEGFALSLRVSLDLSHGVWAAGAAVAIPRLGRADPAEDGDSNIQTQL